MDTHDEIPLEDHRYFRARLDHLESRQPAAVLSHLENGTLTEHLREVVMRAMRAKGDLVIERRVPEDQADELVMQQIVADAQQPLSLLSDPASRNKLRSLLMAYRTALPHLRRSYLSQNETTE
jgi:hypothetical protein